MIEKVQFKFRNIFVKVNGNLYNQFFIFGLFKNVFFFGFGKIKKFRENMDQELIFRVCSYQFRIFKMVVLGK